MSKVFDTTLFIFRRDLRTYDNNGLHAALKQSKRVIPCFIFDPRQVGTANKFKSANAIQFMVESLKDIDKQLGGKLVVFKGKAEDIVNKVIRAHNIDAVMCNRDYTPFSIKRDKAIAARCQRAGIVFEQHADALLTEPEDIMTKQNTPYKVFTAFYNAAKKQLVPTPRKVSGSFFSGKTTGTQSKKFFDTVCPTPNDQLHVNGGRTQGLKQLRMLKNFKNYAATRDFPAQATTHLSAHLKFGTLSIREVYHAIKKQLSVRHPLLRQLYWRDFFTHVAFNFPHVFGKPFNKKYGSLRWRTSKKDFTAWCNGQTGFPVVDAGMRQLNATGFMHNRVRMIVASFLTKDLYINWLWGENYFAKQLVDYDPSVNNGNWQWCASTGCDAQPYFRIFNPWSQQKKYDPQCTYIKRWIPELADVPARDLHNWHKAYADYEGDYPQPMVDHDVARKYTLAAFKKLR